MPGPRRTLGEYLADRVAQFGALGGVVRDVRVVEFEGIDDATISGVVTFGENNERVLTAFEHVRVVNGRPHREKYSYRAFYCDSALFGYDRDYEKHPQQPHHKHMPGRQDRIEWERVTLHEVAEELWSYEPQTSDEEPAS
jgi:hypothetical protein